MRADRQIMEMFRCIGGSIELGGSHLAAMLDEFDKRLLGNIVIFHARII